MKDTIYRDDAVALVIKAIHGTENKEIQNYLMDGLRKQMWALPSAEALPQSEQYKKGFEDAKRAFLLEYARESEDMRKRNAELEVMLNAQKAISAEAVQGEWIEREDWNGDNYYDCSVCGESFVLFDGTPSMNLYHYCPNCGARMKGGDEK